MFKPRTYDIAFDRSGYSTQTRGCFGEFGSDLTIGDDVRVEFHGSGAAKCRVVAMSERVFCLPVYMHGHGMTSKSYRWITVEEVNEDAENE